MTADNECVLWQWGACSCESQCPPGDTYSEMTPREAHVAVVESVCTAIDAFADSEARRTGWNGTPGLLGNWVGGIRAAAEEGRRRAYLGTSPVLRIHKEDE